MASNTASRIRDGLEVAVRYRSRSKMTMKVLDISTGGCLVEAFGWAVKPGETVSVRLPGLGSLAAQVVWNEDQRAGIAFEEPLYGPVLETLLA